METSQQLREAKALIEDPEHWTKGQYALDKHGQPARVTDPRAVKFCAKGAAMHVYRTFLGNFTRSSLYSYLSKAAFTIARNHPFSFDGWPSARDLEASFVNDYLGHKAVMEMYDLAIQRAEEDEAKA